VSKRAERVVRPALFLFCKPALENYEESLKASPRLPLISYGLRLKKLRSD
jgi:hypothetical protein